MDGRCLLHQGDRLILLQQWRHQPFVWQSSQKLKWLLTQKTRVEFVLIRHRNVQKNELHFLQRSPSH